ncbi:MAG: glycosyltransferase, partial [Lachnospiraceae bacterium]|nr:glycosyltransferase [Lachnospiraceae bacterium]
MLEDNLVSIITPLYNAKAYIEETIKSVLSQTYKEWEMIIVDDGSTDGSFELVKEFIDSLSSDEKRKFHLLQNEKNSGITETRNRGLKEAKGRYIAFLDSDDLWDEEKLEKQLRYLKDTEAAFCFTQCRIIDENGIFTGRFRKVPVTAEYETLLMDNYIPCLTVLADRSVIPTEHLMMPNIRHEDYAAWLNVLRDSSVKAVGMQETLASYRVNISSTSGNKIEAAKWHWQVLRHQEKINFLRSIKYMFSYIFKAIAKRKKQAFAMFLFIAMGAALATSSTEAKADGYDCVIGTKHQNTNIADNIRNAISAGDVNNDGVISIYVEGGSYNIESNVPIETSNVQLICSSDTTLNFASEKGIYCSASGLTNLTLSGGVWKGAGVSSTLLNLKNTTTATISDITFKNANSNNLQVYNSTGVTISGVNSAEAVENGIYMKSSSVTMTNCNFYDNTQTGVFVRDGSLTITTSEVHGNHNYGLRALGSAEVYANNNAGNKFYKNDYSGVSANASGVKLYLNGNSITSNGQNPKAGTDGAIGHGVGVTDGAYADISGNTIKYNEECGVSVFSGATAVLSDNNIAKSGHQGVGNREGTVIMQSNNTISSSTLNGVTVSDGANLYVTGTGNVIKDNKGSGISVTTSDTTKICVVNITGAVKSYRNTLSGLYADNYSKITVENSEFNRQQNGVHITLGATCTFKNCKFTKNVVGFYIGNPGSTGSVTYCTFDSNSENNIVARGGSNVTSIANNSIKGGKKGIEVLSSAFVQNISNNTLTKTGGIIVKNASATKIKNNTIASSKTNGIYVYNSAVTYLNNNIVTKSSAHGIYTKNSTV